MVNAFILFDLLSRTAIIAESQCGCRVHRTVRMQRSSTSAGCHGWCPSAEVKYNGIHRSADEKYEMFALSNTHSNFHYSPDDRSPAMNSHSTDHS
jgi:hypothetical protein